MKGGGQFGQRSQGDISFVPLDGTDVRPVQSGSVRQFILGEPESFPEFADSVRTNDVQIGSPHSAKYAER